jgi:hypothetical protein
MQADTEFEKALNSVVAATLTLVGPASYAKSGTFIVPFALKTDLTQGLGCKYISNTNDGAKLDSLKSLLLTVTK